MCLDRIFIKFFIIFGIAIFAIIVNAINDFLQRNQNEERTVAIHAKSCKGDCKPLRHYKIPCVYCKGAGGKVEAFNDQGSSSFVKTLEDRKSAVEKKLDEGITKVFTDALHEQVRKGHLGTVKYCLQNLKSMDLNVQDNDGNTPLHTACENGNIDIAKALLTAGANQNVENKEKKKPFQVAKPKDVEALRKLLSNRRGGWNNKRGKPKNQG